MQDLLSLQEKLDQLLKAFSDLKTAQEKLLHKNKKQQQEIEKLNSEINQLIKEKEINAVGHAVEELAEERKENLKAELDKVIGILNTNINLLK